jgi:hypothetical protein
MVFIGRTSVPISGGGSMEYLPELSKKVTANDEILVVTMKELRDGFSYQRLGPNVTSRISSELSGVGLSHAPEALPEDQHSQVLIYRRGKSVEKIVHAVLNPTENGAKTLRDLTETDANDVLERIKALVCE